MNSIEGRNKNANGHFTKKTSLSLCLFCLTVGFLLGVALDAKYRPNKILLFVNPDTKVSLMPQPGDTISWASPGYPHGQPVNINFTAKQIPCISNVSSPCIYDPIDQGPSLYLYACTLNSAPSTCFDPGIGNTNTTGPPPGQVKFPKLTLKDFADTLVWDIERLFGGLPALPRVSQNLSEFPESSGTNGLQPQGKPASPPTPPPLPPPPPRVQEFVAACSNNAPGIFKVGDPTPTDTVANPIIAEPNDTITLTLYPPPVDYNTNGLSGVCKNGELSAGRPSCIVNNVSVSVNTKFNLSMVCTGSTPTSTPESIAVVKP
jgi:hypothetical protein